MIEDFTRKTTIVYCIIVYFYVFILSNLLRGKLLGEKIKVFLALLKFLGKILGFFLLVFALHLSQNEIANFSPGNCFDKK